MSTSHRWLFYNPVTDTEVSFPINPVSGAGRDRSKQINKTASTEGQPILQEGRRQVDNIAFTVNCGTKEVHDFYQGWYDLATRVRITDDLGQVWWTYLEKLSFKRVNRHSHPWAGDFDGSMIVLQWIGIPP